MAIKELFQDSRPQVLFDPRASQRIDPRFKFTRDGAASYYDSDGVLRYAATNEPRFDHNPVTGESLGLLVEESRTNYFLNSDSGSASKWNPYAGVTVTSSTTIAPDGSANAVRIQATLSGQYAERSWTAPTVGAYVGTIYIRSRTGADQSVRIDFSGGSTTIQTVPASGDWVRLRDTQTGLISAGNRYFYIQSLTNETLDVDVWGEQIELGSFPTSYIPTTSSTVTREPDLLSIEGISLPATGSIYIDARSLSSGVDDTLLSAANASDDKLTLAIRQPADLYNSKALVYEVDGAFKPTLPFPVPTDARERNLITYGANNYHYRSDSSRLTPSSSSSVPANMTRLGIGHDVTDPIKAITGYINTVYLWSGEITPTVAEALVRGDLDPQDADAGVFTPETGALAFVFNTQGTATDGDRVVELPVSGSTNNILVDWGDNTSSSFIGASASSTVSHTYPSAGIYPVQITADDDGTNSGLENLQFYSSSQRLDLVRVLQWGGTTTWQPTTMYRAFRDCTQMDFENAARTNLPDTSAITNWEQAFYNCSSLSGTFPNFDFSGATLLSGAWQGCSSIATFSSSLDDLNTDGNYVLNYTFAWRDCSSITSFPTITLPVGQGAVNLYGAWRGCTNLESFPAGINTSSVTSLLEAWYGCTSLTGAFPALNTSSVTNFGSAWYNCSSLTSFPNIITSEGTTFYQAWRGCSSLASFGPTNFSKATTLQYAFAGWTAFTGSFPAITTSASLTSLWGAWQGNKMTSFTPPTNTSQVTTLRDTFNGCTGLTGTFPTMDTANVTSFLQTWTGCSGLTGFPALNTSNVTDFYRAWDGCSGLTSFPTIDTSKGTRFRSAWKSCSFTSFPALDFSLGTDFASAWDGCALTAFPAVTFPAATDFSYAWRNNPITDFPAGAFDSTGTLIAGAFVQTFFGCALTAASIENILVSLDTNGATGVTLSLNGGTNAAKSTWTSAANTAYTNLIGKGWSIFYNA